MAELFDQAVAEPPAPAAAPPAFVPEQFYGEARLVTCGSCERLQRNALNPAQGVGQCGIDYHTRTTSAEWPARPFPLPEYPDAERYCDKHLLLAALKGGGSG